MEIGSIADWLAAVAALASALFAVQALKTAREANDTARETRQEAKEAADEARKLELAAQAREEARDKRARELEERAEVQMRSIQKREDERDRLDRERTERDAERDRRQLAGSLQAWWAVKMEGERETWGLIVSNEGSQPAAFRDVSIEARGNREGDTVHIKRLPPGRYFVAAAGGAYAWALPRMTKQSETYDVVTSSDKHSVEMITFTDPLGTKWAWRSEGGLRPTEDRVSMGD